MGQDPPRKLLVLVGDDGGRHVEDMVPAQRPREILGEEALAAPRAAEHEGANGYDVSFNAASMVFKNRSFSSAPRTAIL